MSGLVAQTGQSRNLTGCGVIESTFGLTTQTFAATDSFQILGTPNLVMSEDRENRNDVSQSRSYKERVVGRRTNSGSLTSYILPPGGATVPDIGFLLQAGFGTQTIGGSSVTYTLAETLPSFALNLVSPGIMGYHYYGCVAQELVIELPEDESPTITCNFDAKLGAPSNRSTATGTIDGTTTPVASVVPESVLAAKTMFDPGAWISIGTSTAHNITAIDQSTGAMSISPSVTTAQGATPTITPYSPYAEASLAAANVVAITQGQVDWAGTSDVCIKSAEFRIVNNFGALNCFGSETTTDYSIGRRNVSGSIVVHARTPDLLRAHLGRARVVADRQASLAIIFGQNDTTGSPICTVTMPNCEFDFPETEFVEEGANSIRIPFVGQATSAGNDEINMVFGSAA